MGHQKGRRVFREGPKVFELCPIFLNYVQHIFPEGEKFSRGGFGPPGYGLDYKSVKILSNFQNREPNSDNHLGAFYVTCFGHVCEIFTGVLSELQHGPHVVL